MIYLTEFDKANVKIYAGQLWDDLTDAGKQAVEDLVRNGCLSPNKNHDGVIYVGQSLIPQEA